VEPSGQDLPVTTAVIVAAGLGSRLGAADELPKPLRPVVGVPLIARVMACAARAGIRRFVVVIGHRAALMRTKLPDFVPAGCSLDLIENPRFEEPNGVSLMAAATALETPFALLMADHVFTPDRLARALARFARSRRCLLVVEPRRQFQGDLDDATCVVVAEERVRAIGKELPGYDAVDTGMFVLEPGRVVRALREAGPAPSISDGMRVLARRGELDAFDPATGWWHDVDTPEDVAVTERLLYNTLTKSTDGFFSRHVNRRLSLLLSTRLWRYGVTPNMVTACTLVLGVAAGAAFSRGSGMGWGLLGAALFQLQSIVDGVDGELARLLHKQSRFGFWFDVAVDNVTHAAVFGGIAIGLRADHVPGPWGTLGLLAVLGVAASFGLLAPFLDPDGGRRLATERPGLLDRVVDGLSRRDFLGYVLLVVALLGWLGGFLWLAVAGTWVFAGTVLFLKIRARASTPDLA